MKNIKNLYNLKKYGEIIKEINPEFKLNYRVHNFNLMYSWSLYYVFIFHQNPLTEIYSLVSNEIKLNVEKDQFLYQLVEKNMLKRSDIANKYFEEANVYQLYKLKKYQGIVDILNPESNLELRFPKIYLKTYLWSLYKICFSGINWEKENISLIKKSMKIIYSNSPIDDLLYKKTMEKEKIFYLWLRKNHLDIYEHQNQKPQFRYIYDLRNLEYQTDYFDNQEKKVYIKEFEDYDEDFDDSTAIEQGNC